MYHIYNILTRKMMGRGVNDVCEGILTLRRVEICACIIQRAVRRHLTRKRAATSIQKIIRGNRTRSYFEQKVFYCCDSRDTEAISSENGVPVAVKELLSQHRVATHPDSRITNQLSFSDGSKLRECTGISVSKDTMRIKFSADFKEYLTQPNKYNNMVVNHMRVVSGIDIPDGALIAVTEGSWEFVIGLEIAVKVVGKIVEKVEDVTIEVTPNNEFKIYRKGRGAIKMTVGDMLNANITDVFAEIVADVVVDGGVAVAQTAAKDYETTKGVALTAAATALYAGIGAAFAGPVGAVVGGVVAAGVNGYEWFKPQPFHST